MTWESVYPNFMKFSFQTGFRSLISEFIYSYLRKMKLSLLRKKTLILKTESIYYNMLMTSV